MKKIAYKITLIAITLSIFSCVEKQEESVQIIEDVNTPEEIVEDLNTKEVINYLALGDSYTIGQGVEIYQRWPNQLVQKINTLNYEVNKFKIIAQTGWTTTSLLQKVENTEISGFNLVSLLIGVNNQYQKKSFEIFETEFNLLLNKSIEYAGNINRVFVVSIPDYGVTPFGQPNRETISKEINLYNEYIAIQCKEKGIPFINITDISRDLGDSEGALASDNLHPSGIQYTKWMDLILPTVIELLEK